MDVGMSSQRLFGLTSRQIRLNRERCFMSLKLSGDDVESSLGIWAARKAQQIS